MNWPIPSKGRGGSTQQFAPKQNPIFLLRILQIFLKELFARKAASSGMVGIVTKRGKRMIRVFGYLKASISQTSGEVEICITSALKGKPCHVSNDIL